MKTDNAVPQVALMVPGTVLLNIACMFLLKTTVLKRPLRLSASRSACILDAWFLGG